MKRPPKWIDQRALLFLHEESLAMFGGASGIRDLTLLESALAKPRNRHHYDESCDLADFAASYGFGIARNHAFVDGNKRAAFLAIGIFLAANGRRLTADRVDAIQTMMALATGQLDEHQLALWIRANTVKE